MDSALIMKFPYYATIQRFLGQTGEQCYQRRRHGIKKFSGKAKSLYARVIVKILYHGYFKGMPSNA